MDLNFTEEQQMLKTSARDFLERECPPSLVRSTEENKEDKIGFPQALWSKIAGLGWMGMALPEKYGGEGRSFLDLVMVLEEMGRVAVPGPFVTTVLGGLAISSAGTEKQKRFFLPKIAKGDLIFALAFPEEEGTYYLATINTSAVSQGDGYVINGTKLFVDYAEAADYFLCVARVKRQGREPVSKCGTRSKIRNSKRRALQDLGRSVGVIGR